MLSAACREAGLVCCDERCGRSSTETRAAEMAKWTDDAPLILTARRMTNYNRRS